MHRVYLELNFNLNDHFTENNGNDGELLLVELLLHEQFSLPPAVPRGVFVTHSSTRAKMSLLKGSD